MARISAALAMAAMVLLAGCGKKPVPSVNDSMTQVMQPQAEVIWNAASKAYNDKGDGLEATKITQADWDAVAKAGQLMRDRANTLAEAKVVTAATPKEHVMGQEAITAPSPIGHTWDAKNAGQIQAMIDKDRPLFNERARILAASMDRLVKASGAKDVKAFYEVSSNLDEDCDGCHQKFWGTDEPPPFPKK